MTRLFLRSLVITAGLMGFSVPSIVACNAVLGIKDVQLYEKKEGGKEGEDPDPDDPDPADAVTEPDSGVPSRASLLQVVLGHSHTCGRKPEGAVRCWGDDVQGQLGTGTLAPNGFLASPSDVAGLTDAVDISAGRFHTCAARKNGKAACWGFNLDGQLGNGETGNRKPSPVEVASITGVVAVAAGGNFSCALRGGGTVACWGANGAGQLGKGDDSPSAAPVTVPNLNEVVSIAAGQAHACAVKKSGQVLCWGDGAAGQLGKTPAANSPTPQPVDNLTNATLVAAGERSTCAITTTGAVMCWGANELGQLGNGAPTTNVTTAPGAVTNLSDAVSIAVGSTHACAARKTGIIACWGASDFGQLGDGQPKAPNEATAMFVLASGVQGAVIAGAGGEHSCASTANQILCWGANDRGQLGAAGATKNPLPAAVPNF